MMKMNMPTEDAQDCMRELGERSMGISDLTGLQ